MSNNDSKVTRVYRVEHKHDRLGCFTDDTLRIENVQWTDRNHLRSMCTPWRDFAIEEDFSPQYIFAFPTMKCMRYWIRYRHRKAMMASDFVVGVYDVRKIYHKSKDQAMFTRRVAQHVEDLPLIKIIKGGIKR